MGHMSYKKVGRRCHGTRGFRLNSRRFSVQRLRERFLCLFRLLARWKSCYGRAFGSLKRGIVRRNYRKMGGSTARRGVVTKNVTLTHRDTSSFARSNSFYSEAIADCLEFIKRTSISVDDKSSFN